MLAQPLASERLTDVAEKRLKTMVETTDGFRIAEIDLRLRGPGEFFGTRQWGILSFRIANLLRDHEILEWARREASEFVEHPGTPAELARLTEYLRREGKRRYGLGSVA